MVRESLGMSGGAFCTEGRGSMLVTLSYRRHGQWTTKTENMKPSRGKKKLREITVADADSDCLQCLRISGYPA